MSRPKVQRADKRDEAEYTVLSLSITKENKKWLRMKAAQEETSMAAIVDALISEARKAE